MPAAASGFSSSFPSYDPYSQPQSQMQPHAPVQQADVQFYVPTSPVQTDYSQYPPPAENSKMAPMNLPGSLNNYENEPPLLEELEIYPGQILAKALAVSFPWKSISHDAEQDADLAGPFFFCILLGTSLLLQGKIHFGYIFGFGFIGCFLVYLVMNLMSAEGITLDRTMSILGYSLLPIVLLGMINIFVSTTGVVGYFVSIAFIVWSTFNATRFIEKALEMREQRWLIAYPVTLLYACFVMLTLF